MTDFSNYNPYMGLMNGNGEIGEAVPEGFNAKAGQPLQPGVPLATQEQIIEALRTVYDPEIPINIYDLGLIYNIDQGEDGSVAVTMTVTAPACPVAGILPQQVADAISGVAGTAEIVVTLTWEPAWDQSQMSEDARLALGLM